MRWVGVGYRNAIRDWIESKPPRLNSVEITAEHFFDCEHGILESLAKNYATFVHGLGLSLGSPGPLDQYTLSEFSRVAESAQARWISEHVAFTKASDIDLGHLNPLPLTRNSLQVMVDHAREVTECCKRPLVLENITFDLAVGGELSEPEFLNELCAQAQCGLLLDVTNLYINSHNHDFDAVKWLSEIEPSYIRQIHIVGYTKSNGRFRDFHGSKVQPELLDLLRMALEYSAAESVILERDERLEELDEIATDIIAIAGIANG